MMGTRGIGDFLFNLAQELNDMRNVIRRRTGEPELGPLLRPTRGGPSQDPNTENLTSNSRSTIRTRNIHEHLDDILEGLHEIRALIRSSFRPPREPEEPNEPEDPEEPEELVWDEDDVDEEAEVQEEQPNEPGEQPLAVIEPYDSEFYSLDFFQGPAPVSVLDLPVEDRICCICRLQFLHSGNDDTTDIHASMDSLTIDEHDRGLCMPTRLECGHIVGDICIHSWVNHNRRRGLSGRCPVCRAIIQRLPPTNLSRALEMSDL